MNFKKTFKKTLRQVNTYLSLFTFVSSFYPWEYVVTCSISMYRQWKKSFQQKMPTRVDQMISKVYWNYMPLQWTRSKFLPLKEFLENFKSIRVRLWLI